MTIEQALLLLAPLQQRNIGIELFEMPIIACGHSKIPLSFLAALNL
ncbi:hypothetical protein [Reticulibacter mediterranei]|nr:hypothetical protein [Reticulibacter mediterranei]